MKPVGSLLSATLKALGMEEGMKLRILQGEWPNIFAEPLSLHTCPVEIKDGELLIHVDSPVWLQQLKFLKQNILEKLQPYGIKEIRLRRGRLYRFRQKKTSGSGPAAGEKPRKTRPVDTAWIDQALSDIQDPELRESLRRAIIKAATRKP